MKYIRTNYLFGEIISHTKLLNGTHLFSIKDLDKILPISEEDFEKCKTANTIEELCDEFVAVSYGISKKPIVINYNRFETVKAMSKDCEIYGAIWTDKGLIYVAKMNESGVLELI